MSDYVTKTNVLSALSRFKENTDELYETKADASTLKNAIQATDARVSNLEEKAGDYVEVNYRGTDAVPTGKCKKALVNTIVHKTRAWNSLVNNNSKTGTATGLTFTRVNQTVTVSGTYQSGGDANAYVFSDDVIPEYNGHAYLIFVTDQRFGLYVYGATTFGVQSATVLKATASGSMGLTIRATGFSNGDSVNASVGVVIRDVSLIFPEYTADQLQALGVSGLVKICSDLLTPDAFSEGKTISTEVEGVESRKVAFENKTISGGSEVSANNRVLTDFISVEASTQYTLALQFAESGQNIFEVHYFNSSKTWTGSTAINATSAIITTSNTSAYIKVLLRYSDNRTTTPSDWLGKLMVDGVEYKASILSTLSISPASTGHSAGSVADTDELCVEVEEGVFNRRKTTRVGSVDLGSLNWTKQNSIFYSDVYSDVVAVGSYDVVNGLTAEYVPVTLMTIEATPYSIAVSNTPRIYVNDPSLASLDASAFKTAMNGKIFYYEKATYTETLSDPIIDNLITTEGGGTIRTKQTQGTEIDNSLDVGYLAL